MVTDFNQKHSDIFMYLQMHVMRVSILYRGFFIFFKIKLSFALSLASLRLYP